MEDFLRLLQKKYQWSPKSLREVLNKLSKDDVTSVKLLSMCWLDVQSYFPFGMKKMVEKELINRGMKLRGRYKPHVRHRDPKLLLTSWRILAGEFCI